MSCLMQPGDARCTHFALSRIVEKGCTVTAISSPKPASSPPLVASTTRVIFHGAWAAPLVLEKTTAKRMAAIFGECSIMALARLVHRSSSATRQGGFWLLSRCRGRLRFQTQSPFWGKLSLEQFEVHNWRFRCEFSSPTVTASRKNLLCSEFRTAWLRAPVFRIKPVIRGQPARAIFCSYVLKTKQQVLEAIDPRTS